MILKETKMKRLSQKEYKEFIELHKGESRCAIFIENDDTPKKIFWAKTREEAEQEVDKFKSEHSNVKAYYKNYDFYYVLTNDGTNDVLQYEHAFFEKTFEYKGFRGNLSYIWDGIYWSIRGKLENIKYFIKDLFYWIKNYSLRLGYSHNSSEWYCLKGHILEDIKFNVKKMINYMHGCPNYMVEEAKEYFKDNAEFANKDEVDKGVALWKNRLTELLDLVYLYELYESYGFGYDESDEYAMKIYHEYKDTIPYYKNSKDINYTELAKMTTECWNNICNWMMKHGRNLWD
jgi:hypothetical protein